MIVGTSGSLRGLVIWQQRSIVLFAGFAGLVVALREGLGWHWLAIPAVPVAVVGGALGIFVSFRTNAAYARWWEGRQLWGRLVNLSRTFSTQVIAYLPRAEDGSSSTLQRALVERQVLYVHVLRCLLRDQSPWEDPDAERFSTPSERAALSRETNATHAILDRQLAELAREADAGRLAGLRLDALDRTIAGLLDVQGGCERIKRTPMPRGYGYFADQLIRAFGMLFPLALAQELWVAVIPLNVLVCLAFLMINEVGRVLEDPFTMFWNGLPLSALSRTIESNLRQRLGDPEVLPMLKADAQGILM
jgi:ion channel-forming bestrophin family protein